MNDPGLHEPISEDSKDVENLHRDEDDEEKEDEEAYLEPNTWWLASTAFPLIAGTFGPMASAFSICALVVHWRVYIPPGQAEEHGLEIEDPKWLIAVNAVQLVIALISNLALLLNMGKKIRFAVAQPITIIGWYVSSFTLIGLCACASGPLIIEPREDHAFTQAYYYAIFAAAIYFWVAILMSSTFYGAYKGYYEKEFQLTMSQRTLMLQTISFLIYLLAGAAVYSHIEGWKFLDAVYWADFTLLTVGIGDYAPETHLGRSLLFPFAIGGIIIIGLVIGSIRSLVLERGKAKMGARMVEKERERMIKRVEKKSSGVLLEPVTEGKASRTSSNMPLENTDGMTERDRRKHEFHMMRKIQHQAHIRQSWTSLAIWGSATLFLWFVGAAVFQAAEYEQDWSYFGSLYFAYTSLLTIGYGDFYPQSNSGKPFFVLWSLLAVPSLTILISKMGDTIVKEIRDLTLWVANITILPGEKGIRVTLKEGAKQLTLGRFFNSKDNIFAPPGILGEGRRSISSEDGDQKDDPESAAQRVAGDKAKKEERSADNRAKEDDKLPDAKVDYHLLLTKEIGKVLKHLHSSPPRKYTFEEWAWYLKLVGEDEGSTGSHRKPTLRAKGQGRDLGTGVGQRGGREDDMKDGRIEKWSWVGQRSPLMGGKEEAEWVLERLVRTLEWELEDCRRDELESKGEIEEQEESVDEISEADAGPAEGSAPKVLSPGKEST
ncbi:Outward-rectifier potassium channel [Lachnellula hyalina]|uniref:Outward-rectifier potassium channel n=1 Tax=Lachnellula hyalina TaxID=1316788 RepID=A0A8H8QX21_9HELO|nr:Outward-rectifier potassium channel [Lachnellula hyalina]TVY23310.1 Outward-rectifier potassium channel [Lachnellula hyalina]